MFSYRQITYSRIGEKIPSKILMEIFMKTYGSKNKPLLFFIPVPPQKPLIVDDRGRTVEGEMGIGPFREGESLSLECNVPGGKKVISGLYGCVVAFLVD